MWCTRNSCLPSPSPFQGITSNIVQISLFFMFCLRVTCEKGKVMNRGSQYHMDNLLIVSSLSSCFHNFMCMKIIITMNIDQSTTVLIVNNAWCNSMSILISMHGSRTFHEMVLKLVFALLLTFTCRYWSYNTTTNDFDDRMQQLEKALGMWEMKAINLRF